MAGDAQMAAHHFDEHRIALRRPDGGRMADRPDNEARNLKPQAKPDSRGQRSIGDCDRARRPAEQDRIGQRAMHRRVETSHGFMGQDPAH